MNHTGWLLEQMDRSTSSWDPGLLTELMGIAAATIRDLELQIFDLKCEKPERKSMKADVYFHDGEDFAAQFRAVLAQGVTMAAKLSDIQDALTAIETTLSANKKLLEGLNALIASGGLDTAAVQAIVDRVHADDKALGDTIIANTPA